MGSGVPTHPIRSAINPGVMPYALRFYLSLFVAGVLVVLLAVLLSPLGRIVNLLFAIAAGYLTIVIGRRVLGRKQL
jgi:Flp pilus assembly protein TadB